MIARLLGLVALLAPAAGQAAQNAPWAGVYQGTIGRYPVTVCLQSWGEGSALGVYYYHSQLKPIRLDVTDDPARWVEATEGDSRDARAGPRWSLRGLGGDTLTGTWRHGRRAYPITLKGILDDSAADGFPCGSAAFMARRVVPAAFDRTEDASEDFVFTRVRYKAPAHFSDVSIESFAFAPSQPGDAAIVRELEAGLPRGAVEDEFIQCIAGALGSLGIDGFWEQSSSPAYADKGLLAVQTNLGTFCGGAHPNFVSYQRVFDRQTGTEVKLENWLGTAAWGEAEYGMKPIAPALRELALKHWPDESDPECREAALDQSYWNFGLSADGFNLTPDFPHALTACEETATVPWADIEPYLSDEGKAARSKMR